MREILYIIIFCLCIYFLIVGVVDLISWLNDVGALGPIAVTIAAIIFIVVAAKAISRLIKYKRTNALPLKKKPTEKIDAPKRKKAPTKNISENSEQNALPTDSVSENSVSEDDAVDSISSGDDT